MQTQLEGDVFRTVHNYGINVDKEELLRALAYDRDQYDKGYNDGHRAAMDSIVRCKDCRWYLEDVGWCYEMSTDMCENDFCNYGERKGEGE